MAEDGSFPFQTINFLPHSVPVVDPVTHSQHIQRACPLIFASRLWSRLREGF